MVYQGFESDFAPVYWGIVLTFMAGVVLARRWYKSHTTLRQLRLKIASRSHLWVCYGNTHAELQRPPRNAAIATFILGSMTAYAAVHLASGLLAGRP